MNSFLNQVLQLKSVLYVTLLSTQGDPLFFQSQSNADLGVSEISKQLNILINNSGKPAVADILFSGGRIYLQATQLGYFVIVLRNDTHLEKIKAACLNVKKQLSQPEVCKKVLLRMFSRAEDQQKAFFIKALVSFADKDIAEALIPLLTDKDKILPEVKDGLLLLACQALGYCLYPGAIKPLQDLLTEEASGGQALRSDIKEAVQLSLRQLDREEGTAAAIKTEKETTAAAAVQPALPETVASDPLLNDIPEQKQVSKLLSENKKGEALELILNLIKKFAREKQFDKAEMLRDWLMQIDSMAIGESIRAAEIIEEEQKASINEEFYTVWGSLTDVFAPEEFIAFYHALVSETYPNEKYVARQGEFRSSLFFVNSGRVRIYATCPNREVPLKIVQQGEILGAGSFFEVSVWTVNAKSMGAEIYRLSQENSKKLDAKYPGFEAKLQDFCGKIQSVTSLLKKTKQTRRQFDRTNVSGRLTFSLVDQDGVSTGVSTKCTLLDISKGGLSFTVRSSKRNNALDLIAQKIRISLQSNNFTSSFQRTGIVVAVRDHDLIGNEYSVHIEFEKQLSGTELQSVIKAGG